MFRRDRVLAVGGYDARMATEDIDLTWRLLLAGWHTAYEPHALVGMQVPSTLRALWAQRKRWARGQGEVLHVHLGEAIRWRNRRMWLVIGESLASLLWVVCLAASLVLTSLALRSGTAIRTVRIGAGVGDRDRRGGRRPAHVALVIERDYDPTMPRAFLLGPLYPLCFWAISSLAALRTQTVGLLLGPRKQRVVWDIPRESLDAD